MGHSSPVAGKLVALLRPPPRTTSRLVATRSVEQLLVPPWAVVQLLVPPWAVVQLLVPAVHLPAVHLPAAAAGQLGLPPAQRLSDAPRP